MKNHLESMLQILAGLAVGTLGIGAVSSAVLPFWLAQYMAAVFLVAFALTLMGAIMVAILCGGMYLQRREDDARISHLLKRALQHVA